LSLRDLIAAIASLDPVDAPAVLAAVAARLAADKPAPAPASTDGAATLVDAAQAAATLNVPESWLRSQSRAGKLPSVRLGKYIRFDIADVKRALRERQTSAARSRSSRPSLG
jgi:excisionase family DNA binding protein